jgi:hypothetical protein
MRVVAPLISSTCQQRRNDFIRVPILLTVDTGGKVDGAFGKAVF